MLEKFIRSIKSMELEEQILHAGVIVCALGIFFPWFDDQVPGATQLWTGFGYYTGYIGLVVFLLQIVFLGITVSPLLGGPVIIRRTSRNYVRLMISGFSIVMLLCAFSVLSRVTFEYSGSEIRFGIYVSLVGSAVALLYSFLLYHEQMKNQVQELFHHPDEAARPVVAKPEVDTTIPPPPPPPPPPIEDHRIFS